MSRIGTLGSVRGRGIGSALLAHTMADLAAHGYPFVELNVDADSPTGAGRLYERAGFATVSRNEISRAAVLRGVDRCRLPWRGDHTPVHPVPAHPARGSGGRRGAQPSAAGPRRLHPEGRARHLQLAAAGLHGAAQRRADRARGDAGDRVAGGALPGAAAARALRGDRTLDRVRRQRVPAQGPQAGRLPARADARGDVHPAGQGHRVLLQGPAARAVPDPDQVPGRGTPPRRTAARARVRDEGLLLVRRRRRRSGRGVPAASRGLRPDLRPARPAVRHRRRDVRRDGRLGVGGVPRRGRGRRGHLRPVHHAATTRRTSRRSRCRRRIPSPRRGRGDPAGARGGHPEHADDRDPRRRPECAVRARRPPVGGGRHPEERAGAAALSGRHPRAAGDRGARRPGGRRQAAGGPGGAGRGGAVHRGALRGQARPGPRATSAPPCSAARTPAASGTCWTRG